MEQIIFLIYNKMLCKTLLKTKSIILISIEMLTMNKKTSHTRKTDNQNKFGFLFLILLLMICDKAIAQIGETHNVLWIGTSIPTGCHYPENCCENLGWKCYNMSLGASGICVNDGFLNNGRDGKDLCETKEEKAQRYSQYVTDGDMTASYFEEMLNYGYDKRVIPYLDGTKAVCDIVVFDHGYNDRWGSNRGGEDMKSLFESFDSQDKGIDKTDEDFNRSNFIEAFCFLLKKMRETNPNIHVVMCSHIENESGSENYDDLQFRNGYYTCLLQKKLADYFGFPFLNICDYAGFSMNVMPNSSDYLKELNNTYGTDFSRIVFNTKQEQAGYDLITYFQYYCPDGVHPHTDPTGQSEKILTNVVTSLMRQKVLPLLSSIGTVTEKKTYVNRVYGIDGVMRTKKQHGIFIQNNKKYLKR